MLTHRNITVLCVLSFICAGLLMVEQCKPKESSKADADIISSNAYIGDIQCKNCHSAEYEQWSTSDHYKAMLPANDSTVLGDFNNKTLSADGVTSHFFKKNGKYFINTQGNDGNNHDYEVKYTFGYYPLQQYLIEFPGGRMQATRDSWDSKNKKWFHQYPGQKIPSHDWLHWTGNAQNWNTMCASCHSTNLQKNYNAETDTYNTTYSVINVSCEACHVPGKLHVDYANSDDYKQGKKVIGSYIGLGKDSNQIAQINSCAPCHALVSRLSAKQLNSKEIMDDYITEIPSTEHYYADGQANDEVYTYTSFLESQMFHKGVMCSNCHNPHSGKTIFSTNQLCLQCHGKTFDDPSHTFHEKGTLAADCKSCHMPGKYYMVNDYRHDHIFRIPRPDLSLKYGTPNACNNCHAAKTFQWAVDAINKWYGPNRKYHFTEDLIPGSKADSGSGQHLIKLLSDTAVPNIIKATAVYYLGNIQTNNSLNILLNCLKERDPQIRYRALRGLENFSPSLWMDAVGDLLSDTVRAIRIAAANLFISVSPNQVPTNIYEAFTKEKPELDESTLYQADFSVGAVMIGDYYLKQQDYTKAEKFYMLGLKKDTSANYARLNLSVVLSATGRNEQALKILQDAEKIDPKNDHIYFNLGLLYNEMNDTVNALKSFEKAVKLQSRDPRVYYDYGLLLQKKGKSEDAANTYQKGIKLNPTDAELNYALAVLYVQTGQIEKAKTPALVLKQYYSNEPDYQKLIRHLGL